MTGSGRGPVWVGHVDPGWADDTDPCNDAGYYKCGTAKAGPNVGKKVLAGYGRGAFEEVDRGIGIDGTRWCHVDGSSFTSACGAPKLDDEYDDLRTVMAVVDYFSDPANAIGAATDGADGAAGAITQSVYVLRGRGKNGKYSVQVAQYSDDFAFLQKAFPEGAGKITVGARRLGNVMLVVDAGITGLEEWRATEGHPTYYRVGYTAFETAAKVGGAWGGAVAGGKLGTAAGCTLGPGGCVVGGVIGTIGGAIAGAFVADHLTDYIWEATPET